MCAENETYGGRGFQKREFFGKNVLSVAVRRSGLEVFQLLVQDLCLFNAKLSGRKTNKGNRENCSSYFTIESEKVSIY